MSWKRILHNQWTQRSLCALLVLAILLGLWIPGTSLQTAQPEEPVLDGQMQKIETLLLGKEERNQDEHDNPDRITDVTEPQETLPQETKPDQSEPNETQPQDPGVGDGQEGQEDGNKGEDGGEETELDLAMVMTWYKYGTQPKTIVCGPSDTVSKAINTAQLVNSELSYGFSLTGEEADKAQITSVHVKAGDTAFGEISENGTVAIHLPEGVAQRDYTFQVNALLKTRDENGDLTQQEVSFTYVLHFSYSLDLELELSWKKNQDMTGSITCAGGLS